MSRVNNGAGRRPEATEGYNLSMEKQKIVEYKAIRKCTSHVTSLLAMLEQDHTGPAGNPGRSVPLSARLSWVSSGQEEALLFLLL